MDTRITQTIAEARARSRVTPERQAELIAEKERLLQRGQLLMMTTDYAGRERFLNEYRSLSKIINENERELGRAA